MSHRRTDIRVCRIAATPIDAAEVKRTNKMDALIITDAWHVLGRNS